MLQKFLCTSIVALSLVACDSTPSSDDSTTDNLNPEIKEDSTQEQQTIADNYFLSNSRIFILEPATSSLDVSDDRRSFLDSLARAFPEKYTIDAIDGMTNFINYDASYKFKTTAVKQYVFINDEKVCSIELYDQEFALESHANFYDGWRSLHSIVMLSSDDEHSAIIYLAQGEIGSVATETTKNLFVKECDETNGSFFDYRNDYAGKVAIACAVNNYTSATIHAILDQQNTLCQNQYQQAISTR